MKCGFSHCKLGGQVEKSEATKIGSRYFHKDCASEKDIRQQIEELYYQKFQSKEPIVSVRKAINNYINRDNHNPEYILWCLKYKAEKLNSLHGLSYTLGYKANEGEFKKWKARSLKFEFGEYNDEQYLDVDKIQGRKDKKWEDWFGGK